MNVETANTTSQVALRVQEIMRGEHESERLRERRLAALAQWERTPWPDRPRTPLKARRLDEIPVWIPGSDTAAGAVAAGWIPDVTLVNGRTAGVRLPASWAEAGVTVRSLRELAPTDPVWQAVGQGDPADRLQALHQALWIDGLLIHVPAGVVLTEPLTVLHWVGGDAGGVFPRVLLVAEHHASAALVEILAGAADDAHRVLVSGLTEVVVRDGATVRCSVIQQLPPGAEAFLRRQATVHRDGQIEWNTAEFGAALAVSGHAARLLESGGRMNSVTVFFGSGAQHQDYTAAVEHIGPHTTSTILARGVMVDRARSVFTGESVIRKGAVHTDARQKEQTLMLSDGARADAIPSLIIEDNDVFAAHSASAGPVEPSMLYYLESRGIPEDQATRLVVHGFLEPVTSQIHLGPVRDWVRDAVDRKLGWIS